MLEEQLAFYLDKYLGDYVKGLSKEALKISVWNGLFAILDLLSSFAPLATFIGCKFRSSDFSSSTFGYIRAAVWQYSHLAI